LNNSHKNKLCLAENLAEQGRYDQALQLLGVVVNDFPDCYAAYEARSVIYYQQKELKLSILDISKVIELNPDSAAPLFRRGRYYLSADDPASAEKDFSRAIEKDNGYFGQTLRFYRAEARLRLGDLRGARRDCADVNSDYFEMYFFGHKKRSVSDIIDEIQKRDLNPGEAL
jgi:tetratricopeptide (TPR) repeat protein